MEFEDIPVYQYVGKGKLKRLYEVPKGYNRFEWQIHHYIRQKWIERHKEEYEKIKHLQKHFYLPTNMHMELHSKHSKFKEKYGFEIKDLLYG